jgi:hypothetical protein
MWNHSLFMITSTCINAQLSFSLKILTKCSLVSKPRYEYSTDKTSSHIIIDTHQSKVTYVLNVVNIS